MTALGLVPDATRSVTSDLKAAGDVLYVLGPTRDGICDRPDDGAVARYGALHVAMRAGLVRACHDASEGGLAVAIAEMAIGGRLGVAVDLAPVGRAARLREDRAAFAEDPARLVVAVAEGSATDFERAMAGHVITRIGVATAAPTLVFGTVEVPLAAAIAAFRGVAG